MPLTMMITIESAAFKDGQPIPRTFTMEGENISPPLQWSNVPEETKELVLMMEDPDGTGGNFSHWLMYSIRPGTTELPEGIPPLLQPAKPDEAMQGKNSFGRIGYGGPLPAPGSGPHRYQFRLFALDQVLNLKPGLDKEDLQREMIGHIITQGMLTGTYERK